MGLMLYEIRRKSLAVSKVVTLGPYRVLDFDAVFPNRM